MSTTYERCPKIVEQIAKDLIEIQKEHEDLKSYKVKIDFVFAHSSESFAPALRLHGVKALAIARRTSLKDRALGRADAEIAIDAAYWKDATELEQRALLDHELSHFEVDKGATSSRDDLGRPKIIIRKHDYQFGWFKHIAKRYGLASVERQQAKLMFEEAGQAFWPDILKGEPELAGIHTLKAV